MSTSKHNFKKKIHGALLNVLSLEDTYVVASSLISKLLQFISFIIYNHKPPMYIIFICDPICENGNCIEMHFNEFFNALSMEFQCIDNDFQCIFNGLSTFLKTLENVFQCFHNVLQHISNVLCRDITTLIMRTQRDQGFTCA